MEEAKSTRSALATFLCCILIWKFRGEAARVELLSGGARCHEMTGSGGVFVPRKNRTYDGPIGITVAALTAYVSSCDGDIFRWWRWREIDADAGKTNDGDTADSNAGDKRWWRVQQLLCCVDRVLARDSWVLLLVCVAWGREWEVVFLIFEREEKIGIDKFLLRATIFFALHLLIVRPYIHFTSCTSNLPLHLHYLSFNYPLT